MPGSVERLDIDLEALRSSSGDFRWVRMTFRQGLVSLRVARDEMEWSNDRTLSWFGKIENDGGSVLLSIHRDAVFGRIETGAGVYKIEPAGRGYWLYQLDFSRAAQVDFGGVESRFPYEVDGGTDRAAQTSAKTTITVLIVYTNGFKAAYPRSELKAQINLLVNTANLSFKNSKAKIKLKVVGRKLRKYPDGGDLNAALDDFEDGVGVFRKVPGWRDKFAADLVMLLRVLKEDNTSCGLAEFMAQLSASFAPRAYSVVQVGRIDLGGGTFNFCRDQTAAHEIGHNLGCNHNDGDMGIFPFSLGHVFGAFGSVMSTRGGVTTVSHFSNPKVKYQGLKTGTAKLNNAKSLNLVREVAADWR